jgi:hypothetical protein
MQKISKHISYKEGVYSITALRLGLKNDPSDAHLSNMKLIAEKVFEPLRTYNIVTDRRLILMIHMGTLLIKKCLIG